MTQVEFRSRLSRDAPTVFSLYENPDGLRLLTDPGDGVVERTEGMPGMGYRATVRVPVGPFGVRWVSVVVVWERPTLFTDVAERGPFRSWRHEHRVEAQGETAWLHDVIAYELPLGLISERVVGAAVASRLEALFRRRHRRHAELVGGTVLEGFAR